MDGGGEYSLLLNPQRIGEKPQGRSSFAGAMFNLSTTIVGTGILALPATMKVLGLIPGVIMIMIIAYVTDISIELLIKFSRVSGENTYFAVMRDAYRRFGRRLVQATIIIANLGFTVVYMIIIGDVLSGTSADGVDHPGVLKEWFGSTFWNSRPVVLLVITVVVFLPLARHKTLDSLRKTSAVAVALAVVFVLITAWVAIYKLADGSIEMPRLFPEITDSASIWNLFTAFPVVVTAYVCHFVVHDIDNELRDPLQIVPVVRVSLLLSSVLFISTSFFAFLIFGELTLGNVLANFDTDLGVPYGSILNYIVQVTGAVRVVLVFPILFFVLRENFDGLFFPRSKPLREDKPRFRGVSLLLLTVIYLIAIFVPSIWDVFQILGATISVLMGFIFPAIIVLRDVHGIATRREKIVCITMICLAVLSSLVAILGDLNSIFGGKGN